MTVEACSSYASFTKSFFTVYLTSSKTLTKKLIIAFRLFPNEIKSNANLPQIVGKRMELNRNISEMSQNQADILDLPASITAYDSISVKASFSIS